MLDIEKMYFCHIKPVILSVMKLKLITILGILYISVPVLAQGTSAPYSPGITQDAVSYWLPRTNLTVTVTVCKETFKPGEFARYAERYLRMTDVKDKSNEVWKIKSVGITSYGTPDKEQLYTLTFPAKGTRPYIELTDEGILSAVNVHREQEVSASATVPEEPSKKKINPQDYMTEEILMASSTAKMAELTAKEIYNIRESRNSITRGQADFVPTDGETLKFMLEYLTEQENALLTLFCGTTESVESSFTINVDPSAPIEKQILFRFSTRLGVLPVDNLAGEPVWIDITNKQMAGMKEPTSPAKPGSSKNGPFLYYRIPGRANVKIYNNRESLAEQDMQIAQFGNVEVISSTIMGKKADTRITFDTMTGNVLGINE